MIVLVNVFTIAIVLLAVGATVLAILHDPGDRR